MLFMHLLLPPRGSIIRPNNVLLWLSYLFIIWLFRASDTVLENIIVIGAAATRVDHLCVCARPVTTRMNSWVIPWFDNTKLASVAQLTQVLSAYLHLANRQEGTKWRQRSNAEQTRLRPEGCSGLFTGGRWWWLEEVEEKSEAAALWKTRFPPWGQWQPLPDLSLLIAELLESQYSNRRS